MVRILEKRQIVYGENPVFYMEMSGSSTDNKPTLAIANGSLFLETDSKRMCTFNEDSGAWETLFEFGGDS